MEAVGAEWKEKRAYMHANASERRLELFHRVDLLEEGLVLE